MRMSLIRLPSSALVEVAGRDLLHHAAEGPVDSLDHPPGGGPGPAVGVQGAQHPVPQPLGLVDGNQGVEDVVAAAGARDCQHQQVCLLGMELGLLVQGRVLEGVLSALGELFLAPFGPVGVGDPLAGVRVANGVVEDVVWRLRMGRATKSPSFLRSTICRSRLTSVRLSVSGGGDWARAMALAGIATRAARSKAPANRIRRRALPDLGIKLRSFGGLLVGDGDLVPPSSLTTQGSLTNGL